MWASVVAQEAVAAEGNPSPALLAAREAVQPLSTDYDTKLWAWVRERQVAAVHAWACLLGIDLQMHAYPSAAEYLAANAPLSAQLLLGLDLDPASTDDLRQVVSQALAPDGYVVVGIQQTEAPSSPPGAAAAPPPPPPHHHHHSHAGHDHSGLKGNAYNFASSPQHAASFDLVQGQLPDLPCFRTAPSQPLGCVESAYNFYASLCELGPHVAAHPALPNALLEYVAGWPIGARLAERCATQRHFMGFAARGQPPDANGTVAGGAGEDGTRNPYLLRALMGFCMFHSCKEVAPMSEVELASYGVAVKAPREGAAPTALFV